MNYYEIDIIVTLLDVPVDFTEQLYHSFYKERLLNLQVDNENWIWFLSFAFQVR